MQSKHVWYYKIVVIRIPETKWSSYGQVEKKINLFGRTELVTVAKVWDDLLLGVKGQTNLEIAGFLRNVFWCCVFFFHYGVRQFLWYWGRLALLFIDKPWIRNVMKNSKTISAKVISQKGNSPDHYLRF